MASHKRKWLEIHDWHANWTRGGSQSWSVDNLGNMTPCPVPPQFLPAPAPAPLPAAPAVAAAESYGPMRISPYWKDGWHVCAKDKNTPQDAYLSTPTAATADQLRDLWCKGHLPVHTKVNHTKWPRGADNKSMWKVLLTDAPPALLKFLQGRWSFEDFQRLVICQHCEEPVADAPTCQVCDKTLE